MQAVKGPEERDGIPRQRSTTTESQESFAPDMTIMKSSGVSMSRREVADLFHVSPSTVTRWARQGRIPVYRTPGGHYRYPAAAIRRLAGTPPLDGDLVRLD